MMDHNILHTTFSRYKTLKNKSVTSFHGPEPTPDVSNFQESFYIIHTESKG